MESETVDPVNWPLPPTLHKAVPPEIHVLQDGSAGYKSQDLLKLVRREHVPDLRYAGQRTACAATQGIK